jgi:hypothetical protein
MLKYYFEVIIWKNDLILTLFCGDEIIMNKQLIHSIKDNKMFFNDCEYDSSSMDNFIELLQSNSKCIFNFSQHTDNNEYISYCNISETITFATKNKYYTTYINCNIDRDTNDMIAQFTTQFAKINKFVANKLSAI